MRKRVMIEQFNVGLFIPSSLPVRSARAVRRTLDDKRFRSKFGRAIRVFVRQFEALACVQVRVTR